MKQARVFITMNGKHVKTFPKESFDIYEVALKREGWRIATTEEIKAAGFELQEVKPPKVEKAIEKPVKKKAEPKQEITEDDNPY